MGVREIWAELRAGGEGGGEDEEDERRRKRGGGRQPRALSARSPLLVPTQTHLQLRPSTGEMSAHSSALWDTQSV